MILKKETILTESDKKSIDKLLQLCRQSGDEGVPYPVDDEDCCHYLLWDGGDALSFPGSLLGVLGIFPLSDDSAECIAYVRPDVRRRGLFSQEMLPAASDDFCDLEFVFPVCTGKDGTIDEGILAVLNSIGAEYDCTEYRMELTLNTTSDDSPFADISFAYLYPPDAASLELAVSHCRVWKVSSDTVCLTDVETTPEMRGCGYATAMISTLADDLKAHGIKCITVHVSGDNIAALSLYEKTGFRTTETLSYFIF